MCAQLGHFAEKGGSVACAKNLPHRDDKELFEHCCEDYGQVRMIQYPTEGGVDVVFVLQDLVGRVA